MGGPENTTRPKKQPKGRPLTASLFVSGIALALVVAVLHCTSRLLIQSNQQPTEPIMIQSSDSFLISFSSQQYAPALRVQPTQDPQEVIDVFGLRHPRPTIFITGGAGGMSDEDIARTRRVMEEGIAHFAHQHSITVIDGGTESGVMQMIGEARQKHHYKFPLIGIAPLDKVSYPGWQGRASEAELQKGHTHFVLVNSDEWGGESQMIINLTRAISGNERPCLGILINGGKIAEHDIYLATTQGRNSIPILVLDGSGRTADRVSTALKTKAAENAIIRAIVQGGDIRLAPLSEGVPGVLKQLERAFSATI